MIEVRNVSKSFDGNHVLKNISTRFYEGKTNLIIGQSGSGKTVLLKTIIGLHQPDKGDIFFHNRNFSSITNTKEKNLIRREIGMLFQGSALFDSLTVEDNIRFPLDMFSNMTMAEKTKRVDECLDRVNVKNAKKLFPAEISGGMQKRVAIARAIVLNPKYLFCDEPNSGLDPKTALIIDQLIFDITKEYNITTIINTHDMNSVIEIGENIIFIKNGVNAWEGNSGDVMRSDNAELNDFIFASELFKKARLAYL